MSLSPFHQPSISPSLPLPLSLIAFYSRKYSQNLTSLPSVPCEDEEDESSSEEDEGKYGLKKVI